MINVGTERIINFDESLRIKRQQVYDIENYDLTNFNFKTGNKKVYKNFNFSIFVDDYCNADCKFCVAQLRYQHKNEMYQKQHIKDKEEYLTRLKYVLTLIRPLDPSISITGGEPTLSPILTDIMKIVDDLGFRKRTITTNGSGLFNCQDGDTILNNLIKYNWNHLNISRASYNDDLNKEIMRYNNSDEYCSNDMIKQIIEIANNSNLKHRISCLLLKESISCVDEIKNYVDFYSLIGANSFIFRELMDYDKNSINTEKMNYCDINKVKLNDIWNDFLKYPEFERYLNILGYYYYVEIYKYKGITVASESADLNQQYIEKSKNDDIVYEMVFHNNGNLCGSWIDTEEILDKY